MIKEELIGDTYRKVSAESFKPLGPLSEVWRCEQVEEFGVPGTGVVRILAD